ncbi:GFA family protein [Vibrio nigripulchritudo]|uniref:GFA family protein n=1 Tax=Vibrio nigripulchritudo TaxID=28173 RepID=UPI0009C0272F|nr:aldehyde-activating protein [Vibrio nigripulchritudo]
MVKGSCHCGNVQLSVEKFNQTAVSCNCSICSRYASIWGFYTEATVEVSVGQDGIDSYCHGDKYINFNRCSKCGCITHYTSTTPGPDSRLAVNYRMFPDFFTSDVKVRLFDGADTWQFFDES